jgi:hypothetical protein
VFSEVYLCRTGLREYLLRLTIRYTAVTQMAMQKTSVAILGMAVAAIAMVSLVAAALVASRTFPNAGAVRAIGVNVYWDAGGINTTSSIDWGLVGPGESKSFTVYIKNPGSTSEVLSMTTGNWSSSPAQNKIGVSWNREGYALTQGMFVQAVLTLRVDQTVSGVDGFTFDMTITGTAS